jgi:hypothetical protein
MLLLLFLISKISFFFYLTKFFFKVPPHLIDSVKFREDLGTLGFRVKLLSDWRYMVDLGLAR